ncbi:MAG: phosphoglucosamine mutase [Coriobacteriales bacterium]|jgi:phosphoglucosamine mutase|nr:phosphoglucosamine mutase [Coriobacteriales bacterium]
MARYFGTDGVRGIANSELTCEMAFSLGQAAVQLLAGGHSLAPAAPATPANPAARPTFVIGRDSRRSGSMLEAALVAGITSSGGDVLLAGVVPTPAVALLTRQLAAAGGVVISASHNPPEYNGIKFFDGSGYKLTPELEGQFEDWLQQAMRGVKSRGGRPSLGSPSVTGSNASSGDASDGISASASGGDGSGGTSGPRYCVGSSIGMAVPLTDASERYIAHAVGTLQAEGISLAGLRVAVDCGFGAASHTSPEALRLLGADVVAINNSFDGDCINVDCGSTHLAPLIALVAETGADIGLAHDGDADRLLAVDALGNVLDGDVIEAICALDLQARGQLTHNTVVSTVVCNLGFVQAMAAAGIEVVQTAVGDSNVLAAMRAGGYILGGEQSGHTIFLKHNTTGDGLVSGLQLLAAMVRSGRPLSELAKAMTRYPQTTINVPVADRNAWEQDAAVQAAIQQVEQQLGSTGRVLVRASGTEPLVRVMVEAAEEAAAQQAAESIAECIRGT